MNYNRLEEESAAVIIDARSDFGAAQRIQKELDARFLGGMAWKTRNGVEYLYRRTGRAHRTGRSEKSLGSKSPETEAIKKAFDADKARLQEQLSAIEEQLDRASKLIRLFGVNRVPLIAANILRELDKAKLLGTDLIVVGTYALYAYEASAGILFRRKHLATKDVDLLFDAKRVMKLAPVDDTKIDSVMGILRKADKTFSLDAQRKYSASNRVNFEVDLIKPLFKDALRNTGRRSPFDKDGDLEAAEVYGLAWLKSAPRFEAICFDQRGLPLRIVAPDPRAFAMHKFWLSTREDRDPLKKLRDRQQCEAVISVCREMLGMNFDDSDLTAIPVELRAGIKNAGLI